MSKLSDLLNPAPSPGPSSPAPEESLSSTSPIPVVVPVVSSSGETASPERRLPSQSESASPLVKERLHSAVERRGASARRADSDDAGRLAPAPGDLSQPVPVTARGTHKTDVPTLPEYPHSTAPNEPREPGDPERKAMAHRSPPHERAAEPGSGGAAGQRVEKLSPCAPPTREEGARDADDGDRSESSSHARTRPPSSSLQQHASSTAAAAAAAHHQTSLQPDLSHLAETGHAHTTASSPRIKAEPSITPREGTPLNAPLKTSRTNSLAGSMADVHTLRTVADLSIDHGPQSSSRETSAPAAAASTADPVAKLTPTSSTTPANMPPKKRATASKPAVTKKGIAKAKPAPKKRKADEVATRNSGTPASRTSKTPAGGCNTKKSASGTPAAASPGAGDAAVAEGNDTDVGSVDSSGDVFCVCRRPDNHTWMIGCDGGCEDWFHGKCVNIREEDGDLIDKYICPNCTAEGKGNTTWKPMCRRDGCRKPARLRKGNPSKYCTDECGEMFFTARLGLPMDPVPNGASAEGNKKKPMKKKVTAILDDAEDDYLGPLGGALRPPEVKALTAAIPDFEAFRRLGEGVPSPPPTALPAEEDFYVTILDAESRERLDQIAAKKDELRVRRALLKDHDRFVTMTRERAARTAEREGLKPKDMCGYDAQLQWSEAEFSAWRASPIGRAALKLGTLEGEDFKQLAEQIRREEYGSLPTLNRSNGANSDPDGMEVDRDGPRDDGSPFSATPPPLCMRKRCERHKNWQKLALTDVRFEIVDVADAMRALEAEEKEIRQRAVLKWRAMTGSANRVDRASFSSTVTNGGEVEVVDA